MPEFCHNEFNILTLILIGLFLLHPLAVAFITEILKILKLKMILGKNKLYE